MNPKIFPLLLALLDFCAGIVYLLHSDYRHCIYWLAAMTLTLTVTL